MKRTTLAVLVAVLAFAAPASASTIFTGGFETGNLSQWPLQQLCATDGTVYTAASQPTWPTPDEGTNALQFNVADNHVLVGGTMNCSAASGNPRAQIATSNATASGAVPLSGDVWETWSFRNPSTGGIPSVSGSNWYVMQEDFGAPFSGSPPVAFDIKDSGSGNQFRLDVCHDGCASVTTAWNGPVITNDKWYRFLVHKVMSTSDTTGTVEVWLDGVKQTFTDASTAYHTRTLHANCTCTATDAYRFYNNSYRADALTSSAVTTYFDGGKTGTTEADVRRPPTVVATGQTAWNTSTTPKTFNFTAQAGDVLVVYGMAEADSVTISVSGGGLTWTQRQLQKGSGTGFNPVTYLWDATAPSAATVTVSCARGLTSLHWGCGGVQLRNSAGYDASAKAGGPPGSPSVNVTTTQPHDALVAANNDWNAVGGTSTWAGTFTEVTDVFDSGRYGAYGGYRADATSAGVNNVGMSAPTGQKWGIVVGAYKGM